MSSLNKPQQVELSDILHQHGASYKAKYSVCTQQRKALWSLSHCRTSQLGGHIEACGSCGYERIAYNSCRNRHCNKCQYLRQEVWVDKLKSTLPSCRYSHLVFTVPSCLHQLFYSNQRVCYGIIMQASAQALMKVANNPNFLGARAGAVSVLHTWGQTLTYHPHVHMIVPAGGLSKDGSEWTNASKSYFLPVKALAKVFRGICFELLVKHIEKGKIHYSSELADFKKQVYEKNWHVYAKKPLKGPNSVVQYLGRYTHRVAISNHRILSSQDGKVRFRWKNYRKQAMKQTIDLDTLEFIRRFMQHILPSGFCKVRYYGILSSAHRKKDLEKVNDLIGKSLHPALLQGLTAKQALTAITGKDLGICPKCAGVVSVKKRFGRVLEKPS